MVAIRTFDSERLDALLLRVADSDQDAFAALYAALSARVLWTVRAKLVDLAQSEEVTQEVFLEVWQRATLFDPSRGRATTWVLTMAARRAIDRVRSSQTTRERDTDAAVRAVDTPHDQVWEAASIRIEHERAVLALDDISQVQRQAVRMSYLDGLSQSEISQLLGVPIGTIKTRIRDGLSALRRVLAPA